MDNQTAIIIIGTVALLVIVLLAIKNRHDRKKLFPPTGSDPVEEQQTMERERRDKL